MMERFGHKDIKSIRTTGGQTYVLGTDNVVKIIGPKPFSRHHSIAQWFHIYGTNGNLLLSINVAHVWKVVYV